MIIKSKTGQAGSVFYVQKSESEEKEISGLEMYFLQHTRENKNHLYGLKTSIAGPYYGC